MFARFEIGLLTTSIGQLAQRQRRKCSGRSTIRSPRWKVTVEDLLRRTDNLDVKIGRSGFGSSDTQIKSFGLFNDWRHILFKIPHEESQLLYDSAKSIGKLLHVHLDKLSQNTNISTRTTSSTGTSPNQDFRPSSLFLDDLTTGIYAWGRTAIKDPYSPMRAESLFNKFLRISDNNLKSNKQIAYLPTSNMYSALVYCWSQASENDKASEKCLCWFQKIRENQSMVVDSATWNALLRIHVRQRKLSTIERNLLDQYSSLNDGYTFASLVEGWMNSGLPDGPKNAYEELQRGITYCIDKEDQIPALKQLLFLYLTQNTKNGQSERVMNQAIGIQENHTELEILDLKHFIVAMNALAAKGNTDKVNELYQKLKTFYERGAQRLKPNYQVLVIVLSAIAKKKDAGSLQVGEDLLSTIEAYMLENESSSDRAITNHAYNVMLDFYVRSPHANGRRERIENLMERMKQLSIEYNNPRLLPDKVSYASLMKAIIKESKPGFFSDIDNILDKMEHSDQISIQPDRRVYTIVLEAIFISDDDNAALLRAKDVVERMKKHTNLQLDRFMYTTLIKIHSLFKDVHGSDEVLRTMIKAYNSGRKDCRPNEEAFVTAMSTWEQSGRKYTFDGALRIFNDMIGLYTKGNPECRPSVKSFGKLMVILAKSEHESKLQTGRRLFSEMEKYGVDPDLSLFNWYIQVCATTNSKERSDRIESWTEALGTFHTLRKSGMANSHTYNSIFHVCDRLLHNQDDQYPVFRDIFSKCQDDGKVDRRILTTLKRLLPFELYRELTTLDRNDNGIHMKKIPASWKRNIGRHKK